MDDEAITKKLNVLSKIAFEFNKSNITWAIGGSLLLFFKDKCQEFHDIDILIVESDVKMVNDILSNM